MKKLMLSIIALMAVTASSVFGMYAADANWVDFLTHGNQLRARLDQFGFVLGNGTIKGTFGFRGDNTILQSFVSGDPNQPVAGFKVNPTISAGIGYTSEAISAGVGYSYTYKHDYLSTHTPVLMLNFLNNNLRVVVPVSIAMNDKLKGMDKDTKYKYTGISTDTHIRYYTGLEAFSQLRLYVKYGMNQAETTVNETKTKASASSLGIDFRAYFGANVDNLPLTPFIKVTYDTSLDAKGKYVLKGATADYTRVTAGSEYGFVSTVSEEQGTMYDKFERNPYKLRVLPTLGITASSDIITVYVEPGLGYSVSDDGQKGSKLSHSLAWNAYGEVTVTPLPNLEWYFEMEAGSQELRSQVPLQFNTSTGITWYLPSLQE